MRIDMRFEMRRGHAFLMLALAGLAGCDPVTVDVVDLSVELSSAVLSPPDSIRVGVVVTNLGLETATFGATTCPQSFMVVDGEPRKVGPEALYCTLGFAPVELGPGESLTLEHYWSGEGVDGPVPSGHYHVIGKVGDQYSEWVPLEVRR